MLVGHHGGCIANEAGISSSQHSPIFHSLMPDEFVSYVDQSRPYKTLPKNSNHQDFPLRNQTLQIRRSRAVVHESPNALLVSESVVL